MRKADSTTAAEAFKEGVERGIEIANERIQAFLTVIEGQQLHREMLQQVITGELTPEMMAERLGKPWPLASTPHLAH